MAPPTKILKRYRTGVVINVTPHTHRLIEVIGGYQRCLKVQFRWLGRYSWYCDDSRSKQVGGASDDWKPILDDIVGTNGSGMAVRGGQGGTGVTEVGIVVTEVAEGGVGLSRRSWIPQASETQALGDLWHTAGV